MRLNFSSPTSSGGVTERLFTLGEVPGVLWTPEGAEGPRPLVLLGHGGGQHKRGPGLVNRARRLVTNCGFAAASIETTSARR